MSNPEQLKEAFNKEKDEKKVKKNKYVKSSEGKSKSSSRKSSTIALLENSEVISVQDEVIESGDEIFVENKSPATGILEMKLKDEIESFVPEDDPRKLEEKNVIVLREMDFKKLAELKEAFHLFDINNDGYIDKEDLKFTFTSMGKLNVTDDELEKMLSEMSSGDVDDFVKLFGYKAIEFDPEEELLAALSKWDYQGNGMISEEILKRDLQSWGDKFTEKEAERALEEAPLYKKDGTTMIDYIKFCQDICGLRNIEKTRQIEKEADAYDREIKSLVK